MVTRNDATRHLTLDAIRGFALFGILVMNIQTFAFPGAAYFRPTLLGPLEGANLAAWVATHVFGDLKFLSLFSMLYGAGIVLATRHPEGQARFTARQGWLLVFGMIHAYFIWYGDILVTYALLGFVVVGARAWPVKKLLIAASVCLAIPLLTMGVLELLVAYGPAGLEPMLREGFSPNAEALAQETAAYRGSWVHQMPVRALTSFETQTFGMVISGGWRAMGFMLLGMAFIHDQVLIGERPELERALCRWGFSLGLPLAALSAAILIHLEFPPEAALSLTLINYVASIGVAIGLCGGLLIFIRRFATSWAVTALAAAGRMAFTHYIAQSLICSVIFYGEFFGTFGRWSRWELIPLTLAIWGTQVALSPMLLRALGQGPLERLWRYLTAASTRTAQKA